MGTDRDAVHSTRSAHVTDLDAPGEFHIHGLRPGQYRMTLRLGNSEIELPAVEVGESTA